MKQALQSCADQHDAMIKGDIPLSLQALRSGDYKVSKLTRHNGCSLYRPGHVKKKSQPDAGRPFLT
jgi:hypothetical protein